MNTVLQFILTCSAMRTPRRRSSRTPTLADAGLGRRDPAAAAVGSRHGGASARAGPGEPDRRIAAGGVQPVRLRAGGVQRPRSAPGSSPTRPRRSASTAAPAIAGALARASAPDWVRASRVAPSWLAERRRSGTGLGLGGGAEVGGGFDAGLGAQTGLVSGPAWASVVARNWAVASEANLGAEFGELGVGGGCRPGHGPRWVLVSVGGRDGGGLRCWWLVSRCGKAGAGLGGGVELAALANRASPVWRGLRHRSGRWFYVGGGVR